ncbi:pyridine nucleotide-disulfide oxidoreductase [Brevibacillus parabrevis]|uniref:NAD(P)/FAD-dependent oxidoreductase n=1 Tax=Brevibacillus parabrevis TaxID=54914 RepID=UPI0007AB873F|nr:FAD-dependent oxidoreductase [Brevibacillus parabrevis]KZE43400.1 pyridine nucleotide-disulfide oxidoreductase [Brevibacillus parabrevis]
MKEMTVVVVGGGYAGINAVKAIQDTWKGRPARIVLIDKEPYHLRKVLLFKPAVSQTDIAIPLKTIFPAGVEFLQGTVVSVQGSAKMINYVDKGGKELTLAYDVLVLAVGSVARQAEPEQGGIALSDVTAAETIRNTWQQNMRLAVLEKRPEERQRLLTIAVAGAGISGIETASELAFSMRQEAQNLGIAPHEVTVYLLNAQNRLFTEGPVKMARKLEQALVDGGVTVLHGTKAIREQDGQLSLSTGPTLAVGLCIWALGLLPNPALRQMGLPLTTHGQLVVDESYRVAGAPFVYSIGDCARIVDPASGQADRMTCKEASGQAARLGKIILADLDGTQSPVHKSYMDFYCVGLGPERAIVWTRKWGVDIILTGKLGWKLRQFTWNIASMIK